MLSTRIIVSSPLSLFSFFFGAEWGDGRREGIHPICQFRQPQKSFADRQQPKCGFFRGGGRGRKEDKGKCLVVCLLLYGFKGSQSKHMLLKTQTLLIRTAVQCLYSGLEAKQSHYFNVQHVNECTYSYYPVVE